MDLLSPASVQSKILAMTVQRITPLYGSSLFLPCFYLIPVGVAVMP
jgi:hypothetical protein